MYKYKMNGKIKCHSPFKGAKSRSMQEKVEMNANRAWLAAVTNYILLRQTWFPFLFSPTSYKVVNIVQRQ